MLCIPQSITKSVKIQSEPICSHAWNYVSYKTPFRVNLRFSKDIDFWNRYIIIRLFLLHGSMSTIFINNKSISLCSACSYNCSKLRCYPQFLTKRHLSKINVPCGSKLFSISHNLLMRREQNLNSKFRAAGTIQDTKFPLHYNATLKLTVCVTRNNWSIFIWLFIQSYLLVLSLLFYFFEEISCLTVSNCIMSVNSRLRHIL